MAQWVRTCTAVAEDPSWVLSACVRYLTTTGKFQLQGVRHPLLVSMGTAFMCTYLPPSPHIHTIVKIAASGRQRIARQGMSLVTTVLLTSPPGLLRFTGVGGAWVVQVPTP